jgi:hypothetical protein
MLFSNASLTNFGFFWFFFLFWEKFSKILVSQNWGNFFKILKSLHRERFFVLFSFSLILEFDIKKIPTIGFSFKCINKIEEREKVFLAGSQVDG